MAVCTPQALLSGAACMDCPPDGWRDIIAISQLVAFSGYAGGPSGLAAARGAYGVFTGKNVRAAVAYLLASNGGYSTSPSVLLSQAGCLVPCLTSGQRKQVEMYLWGLNNGAVPTASSLMKAAAPYQAFLGSESSALLYLLDSLHGVNNPKAAMAGATCISCALNEKQIDDVIIYLLCQGLAMNIIPPGTTYGGPGTLCAAEHDVTLQPNSYYKITFGSNETSATLCGDTYSPGAGQSVIVYTGSCTLLQLCGVSPGLLVTAIVIPQHNVAALPNGFTFQITSSTVVTASWGAPPAPAVSATELWTSTDGVNYTLAATVAVPGTSTTVTAPTIGNVLYGKIRWLYPTLPGVDGPFTVAQEVFGAVTDWMARVVTNGGAAVSAATGQAMNTFYGALNAVGTLIGKIKTCICVTPGSFIEAVTPLIKAAGNDPWGGSAPNYDLTVNGIRAVNANIFLATGVVPSTTFASTSDGGLSCYVYTTTNADSSAVDMGSNNSNAQTCQLYTNFSGSPGSAFGQIYNNTSGSCGGAGHGTGFYCTNVTGAAAAALYYGSSSLGFTTLGTIATGGGSRPTNAIYAMGLSTNGTTTGTTTVRRYSFFAIHSGLTQTEAKALFNAVQALRVALGGGWT